MGWSRGPFWGPTSTLVKLSQSLPESMLQKVEQLLKHKSKQQLVTTVTSQKPIKSLSRVKMTLVVDAKQTS